MTEDQLEQETLGWLCEQGYTHLYGPDIAHDGDRRRDEDIASDGGQNIFIRQDRHAPS